MAKTLVVKLAGTVDNDDLRKLGEMRIQITPTQDTVNSMSQNLYLNVTEPIQLKLTGDGHFTDSTLEQNLGTTITLQTGANNIYVSNGTSTLHIYNKYAITALSMNFAKWQSHVHWKFNYADFEGMYALQYVKLFYADIIAGSSLASFRDLHNLTYLFVVGKGAIGDLSDIEGLTGLTTLIINDNKSTTGNISRLAGMTNLATLSLTLCRGLTGDTSSLAHLHPNNGGKLASFAYTNTGITGEWPPASE